MNENDLGLIVEKNSARFNLLISDKVFPINKTRIFQAENPVTEPTTRGGVYVADLKERKIEAVFLN